MVGVRPARAREARLLFFIAACLPLAAQDPKQILNEAQRRVQATSEHYQGSLQVIDAKGKSTEKQWTYDRIGSAGNSKVVMRFTAPAEVKGVAILIVNHPDRASDQWMWTPALQRERRIAVQDRRTRFFGTDFSFEDLEERDVEQYTYAMKGEETIDGERCWKIESKPRSEKSSQYTSSLVWVRQPSYSIARVENYTDSKLVRRIDYRDMQQVQNIWTARSVEVADLTRNSRTRLKLESLQYNRPQEDKDFTIQALRIER
jgi:outer membrane lipoprotein-sorting protein